MPPTTTSRTSSSEDPTRLKARARNREAPRTRYVSDAELAALVAAAQPRFANLLFWLYLTGMRVSDALGLKQTAMKDDRIRWQEGKKRSKPRPIVWTPTLRDLWKRAAGSRIGDQHVFLGLRGPYTLDGFESSFARVRKRAGIEDSAQRSTGEGGQQFGARARQGSTRTL